jgi:serine/threonine protein kinase
MAIKQLLVKTQKNIDEFFNEVVIISGVKHQNLVKLKGCCLRDNKRLLVYEYLENGDLANLFFNFDKCFHTLIIFSFSIIFVSNHIH